MFCGIRVRPGALGTEPSVNHREVQILAS